MRAATGEGSSSGESSPGTATGTGSLVPSVAGPGKNSKPAANDPPERLHRWRLNGRSSAGNRNRESREQIRGMRNGLRRKLPGRTEKFYPPVTRDVWIADRHAEAELCQAGRDQRP